MQASSHVANPFGMLIDPAAIQRALEGSPSLERLNRRICRPLDRTAVPAKSEETERASFDAAVEQQPDEE